MFSGFKASQVQDEGLGSSGLLNQGWLKFLLQIVCAITSHFSGYTLGI